jgi:CelD/BcsL family acetyltransferase involved in cellulose biosynthesis
MNVAIRQSGAERAIAFSPARALARVEVSADLHSAGLAWRSLETKAGVYSPYQRYDWAALWHQHIGSGQGHEPLVITGFDETNAPLFVWPFVRGRFGSLQVATFAGGSHATINMPLWYRDYAAQMGVDALHGIFDRLRTTVRDVDLILLFNQPYWWNGVRNPFSLLPHQRAAEDNFRLTLGQPGAEIIAQQISATMRGRLRNKERRLAKLKKYHYARATEAADVDRWLDTFFIQKAAKLASLGIPNVFAEPGIEAFFRAACHLGLAEGAPLIELHGLEGDGELLALFSGIHDGQRFTSNFNSHTLTDYARFSPGLILLQYVIRDCADRGFEAFDVGPGEARYKTFFCKELEPLFDSVLPLSYRGHVAAPFVRSFFRAKTTIKRTPLLWELASSIRRALAALR